MIQCPNMPENTGPWHRTSEHSSPGAHPVVFSIPTSVNTNNGLSVPFGSGTVRNLMPGQPHQMHTNILLDPSLCVLRGSPVATSAFLSTLSAPDLLKKFWVVLAKCIQSSTKSGIGWDWWTYFSSCSELEIVLRPQKCYWAQMLVHVQCKSLPVILPLFYLLLLPLHLLQQTLQQALCSETMSDPL